MYLNLTQFDDYGSANPSDSSYILFSKSTDSGETWTPAKRINEVAGDCIDKDETVEGALPTVGPNGEVYVSWAGPQGNVFDRSLDQGETWLEDEIPVDPMPAFISNFILNTTEMLSAFKLSDLYRRLQGIS